MHKSDGLNEEELNQIHDDTLGYIGKIFFLPFSYKFRRKYQWRWNSNFDNICNGSDNLWRDVKSHPEKNSRTGATRKMAEFNDQVRFSRNVVGKFFLSNANVAKAYLMDVRTKLFIATDSSPAENTQLSIYEICSGMIEMVDGISNVYEGARWENSNSLLEILKFKAFRNWRFRRRHNASFRRESRELGDDERRNRFMPVWNYQ